MKYEIYRMMSKFGEAAVVDVAATKAEATRKLKAAKSALQNAGFGRKVKVVIRDTSNRINPASGVDPFATLAAAASLGWNMAVSNRLKKLEKRDNPTLLIAANPGGRLKTVKGAPFDVADPKFQAALRMFRKFQLGDNPMEVVPVRVPKGTPKFLVALGKAPEVTYAPRKGLKKGNGPPFMHEWDEPPYLATDATGKYLGYVGMGKGYKITPEGIHG